METGAAAWLVGLSAALVFLFLVRTSVAIGDWRTRRRIAAEMRRLRPRVVTSTWCGGCGGSYVEPGHPL